MIYKSLIVVVLLAIVASLGSGLFFMLNDKGRSKRMVNSLTVRISLSVALFILLFVGWYFGLIQPHPVTPPAAP
jgi:cytochrome bd-type quinol oxidase subunit 2